MIFEKACQTFCVCKSFSYVIWSLWGMLFHSVKVVMIVFAILFKIPSAYRDWGHAVFRSRLFGFLQKCKQYIRNLEIRHHIWRKVRIYIKYSESFQISNRRLIGFPDRFCCLLGTKTCWLFPLSNTFISLNWQFLFASS